MMADSTTGPVMSGDASIAWRMGAVEEQYKQLDGKVDKVQTDLSDMKTAMADEFKSLRKDLFEEPHFLTIQQSLMAESAREHRMVTIEDNIKSINILIEKMNTSGVSTARHYTTVGIAIAGVFIAPFVADYLGRLS